MVFGWTSFFASAHFFAFTAFRYFVTSSSAALLSAVCSACAWSAGALSSAKAAGATSSEAAREADNRLRATVILRLLERCSWSTTYPLGLRLPKKIQRDL